MNPAIMSTMALLRESTPLRRDREFHPFYSPALVAPRIHPRRRSSHTCRESPFFGIECDTIPHRTANLQRR
jgi:hypothetical protein